MPKAVEWNIYNHLVKLLHSGTTSCRVTAESSHPIWTTSAATCSDFLRQLVPLYPFIEHSSLERLEIFLHKTPMCRASFSPWELLEVLDNKIPLPQADFYLVEESCCVSSCLLRTIVLPHTALPHLLLLNSVLYVPALAMFAFSASSSSVSRQSFTRLPLLPQSIKILSLAQWVNVGQSRK